MGWGTLPEPGAELGPCVNPCEHTDCAATRRTAESACTICGEPIGYGVKFYFTRGGADAPAQHALCAWKEEEQRQAARRGREADADE